MIKPQIAYKCEVPGCDNSGTYDADFAADRYTGEHFLLTAAMDDGWSWITAGRKQLRHTIYESHHKGDGTTVLVCPLHGICVYDFVDIDEGKGRLVAGIPISDDEDNITVIRRVYRS
jgi:hypothetical protein